MNPTLSYNEADLEAGSYVPRSSEVGESEANDMSAIRPGLSEMTSNATLPVNQAGNTFPQLVVAHYAGPEGSNSGNAPTQAGQGGVLVGAQAPKKQEVDHGFPVPAPLPVASSHRKDVSESGREDKPPPIEDFDGSADALWELYVKEAKSNDESQIQSLNDDMDGVLIFAGLFSAVLTAFVIDSKENLKVNPQDQMVYYLQQNVALLDQISKQILSIAPQVSIPSTPPPPFPSFKPLNSDIRVNVFWFMALIFSLAAALLAILMQQWVRDYMHVFQRNSDPLKCARVRQYLHDGLKRGWMPGVAEAVPGFLHVSLFLFFAGLCDFVLKINTTIGIYTTVPIATTGLLYIFATFVPIIRPQSPYQTWFSTIFYVVTWYPKQILDHWRYQDRDPDGAKKPVRQNMSQRRMQLAMEETDQRKGRDGDAIQWLIRRMTEDSGMESLVMAIPGSFNCEWGLKVWENINVSKPLADGPHTVVLPGPDPHDGPPHSTTSHIQGGHIMHDLNARVAHLMETCKNRELFASEELWRKRTRGCVGAVVSLVCFTHANLTRFRGIAKLLGDIGVDLTVRESSSKGKDQMFVMRWTYLSLLAIRPILASDPDLHVHAELAISSLTEKDQPHTGENQTPTRIIKTFNKALECLEELSSALKLIGNIEEAEAKRILEDHQSTISTLAAISDQCEDSADQWIQAVQRDLVKTTHRIICQLPGIKFADPDAKSAYLSALEETPLCQLKEMPLCQLKETPLSQLKESYRDPHKFQFITTSHRLKSISQVAHTFRNLFEGQWNNDTFKESTDDLQKVLKLLRNDPLRREVWRLQDLHDGGGLGFTVELFFLSLKQLSSTSSSKGYHSAFLTGMFQAITSDRRLKKYKKSLGTQMLLLDWVVSDYSIVFDSTDTYPDPIIDEYLKLLADILEGQGGSHIDDIVQQIENKLRGPYLYHTRRAFYEKALEVITQARGRPSL